MRNVLVTGASRGLGLAMAERLASDGFRVIALARTQTEGLSSLIELSNGQVCFQAYDLLLTEGLNDLVGMLRRKVGPIYGLVNNAGIGTSGLLVNLSAEKIETLVRMNTLSPMLLTRAVARSMLAQGAGRVVNISSIVASSGFNALSVYSATKASLLGFTRALARELGPVGITVNAVAPGFVGTEMTSGLDGEALEKITRRSPLGRLAEPQDVAAAVAFLMSDQARNVTGQVLTIDAGSTA